MNRYYLYCKKADFKQISEKFQISPMLARIIRNRDIVTEAEIEEYLNGGTDRLFDPFLMKGMEEAVPLLLHAIQEQKKIRIIGDYDTDGVCSSYILKSFLNLSGAKADIRLPNRMMDGYGMNADMVMDASDDGIGLIITCDNGVSSYEAVQQAKEEGIPVVITDHHEVPLPLIDGDAVIDPKQEGCEYPYKELCGAGVAYKVVSALEKKLEEMNWPGCAERKALLDDLLQFVGMATIADVVPLTGENRILAKAGIERLRNTENPGLNALFKIRGIDRSVISSYHIGFVIAPCINSAGRLEDAEVALKMLEETDPHQAEAYAQHLSSLNEERKEMTVVQTKEASAMAQRMQKELGALPPVLVLFLPDAHESIAGIIAGRLKEEFGRPVLVLTNSEDGIKGSGRSVDIYPMIDELRKHESLFRKLGGHAKAAGFTLAEGISPEDVSRELNASCSLTEEMLVEKKWIDMQLPFQYISEAFVQELSLLEPFGIRNEKPVFAEKDIHVKNIFVFGKNNNVLKLELVNSEGYPIEAIKYGSEEQIGREAEELASGKQTYGDDFQLSFTFYPTINEFRGIRTIQLRILDFL